VFDPDDDNGASPFDPFNLNFDPFNLNSDPNSNANSNSNSVPDVSADTDSENTRPWWDTDGALESLKLEKSVHAELSDAQLAKQIVLQASPQAAASLIHLALHGRSDSARLNAAKYILDMVKEEVSTGASAQAWWESAIADAVSKTEVYANTHSSETETD
jgi:hypothetical protein